MPTNKKQFSRGLRKAISAFVVAAFLLNTVLPVYAQSAFVLPVPGEMVHLSAGYAPPILKAVKVNPDNPFAFNFIVDTGSSKMENSELQKESNKLIRYFLASLTTPEDDLWVNLSPYEKDRVVPNSFGVTEMGRDLLAQDYLLKQITATLMYPEEELGKKFWDTVYQKAYEKYGTTNIMANTFNKVWIIPEKAVVYENGMTAFVSETKLKVMLEEDYKAMEKSMVNPAEPVVPDVNNIGSQVVREIIIPELEKEVNAGKNFASLRQVYNSLILANWYKKRLRDSILTKIYVDKNKVTGVDIEDKAEAQKIYEQYLAAFKKGVYNYIKEDVDPVSKETTPRKYFSGGMNLKFDARNATEVRQGMPPEAARVSSSLIEIDAKFDLSQKGVQVPAVSTPGTSLPVNRRDILVALAAGLLSTVPDFVMAQTAKGKAVTTPGDEVKRLSNEYRNIPKESTPGLRGKQALQNIEKQLADLLASPAIQKKASELTFVVAAIEDLLESVRADITAVDEHNDTIKKNVLNERYSKLAALALKLDYGGMIAVLEGENLLADMKRVGGEMESAAGRKYIAQLLEGTIDDLYWAKSRFWSAEFEKARKETDPAKSLTRLKEIKDAVDVILSSPEPMKREHRANLTDLQNKIGAMLAGKAASSALIDDAYDPAILQDIQKRYGGVVWDDSFLDWEMFSSRKNAAGQQILSSLMNRPQRDMTARYRQLLRELEGIRSVVSSGGFLTDEQISYLRAAEAHFRLLGQIFTEDEDTGNIFPTKDLDQVMSVLQVSDLRQLLDVLESATLRLLINDLADKVPDGWRKINNLKVLWGGETVEMELKRYKDRIVELIPGLRQVKSKGYALLDNVRVPGGTAKLSEAAVQASVTSSRDLTPQADVFTIGRKLNLLAHGIEDDKGGLIAFLKVILEGRIVAENGTVSTGTLTSGDPARNAGAHGPFYAVLGEGYSSEVDIRPPESDDDFSYFLFPSVQERNFARQAVDAAVAQKTALENRVISPAAGEVIKAKLLTYGEFVDRHHDVLDGTWDRQRGRASSAVFENTTIAKLDFSTLGAEIDKATRKTDEQARQESALRKAVLDIGNKMNFLAYGVRDSLTSEQYRTFVNVALEGSIPGYDTNYRFGLMSESNPYGPQGDYFAVLNPDIYNAQKSSLVRPQKDSDFAYFLFPNDEERGLALKILWKAREQGLINDAQQMSIRFKLVTYREFINKYSLIYENLEAQRQRGQELAKKIRAALLEIGVPSFSVLMTNDPAFGLNEDEQRFVSKASGEIAVILAKNYLRVNVDQDNLVALEPFFERFSADYNLDQIGEMLNRVLGKISAGLNKAGIIEKYSDQIARVFAAYYYKNYHLPSKTKGEISPDIDLDYLFPIGSGGVLNNSRPIAILGAQMQGLVAMTEYPDQPVLLAAANPFFVKVLNEYRDLTGSKNVQIMGLDMFDPGFPGQVTARFDQVLVRGLFETGRTAQERQILLKNAASILNPGGAVLINELFFLTDAQIAAERKNEVEEVLKEVGTNPRLGLIKYFDGFNLQGGAARASSALSSRSSFDDEFVKMIRRVQADGLDSIPMSERISWSRAYFEKAGVKIGPTAEDGSFVIEPNENPDSGFGYLAYRMKQISPNKEKPYILYFDEPVMQRQGSVAETDPLRRQISMGFGALLESLGITKGLYNRNVSIRHEMIHGWFTEILNRGGYSFLSNGWVRLDASGEGEKAYDNFSIGNEILTHLFNLRQALRFLNYGMHNGKGTKGFSKEDVQLLVRNSFSGDLASPFHAGMYLQRARRMASVLGHGSTQLRKVFQDHSVADQLGAWQGSLTNSPEGFVFSNVADYNNYDKARDFQVLVAPTYEYLDGEFKDFVYIGFQFGESGGFPAGQMAFEVDSPELVALVKAAKERKNESGIAQALWAEVLRNPEVQKTVEQMNEFSAQTLKATESLVAPLRDAQQLVTDYRAAPEGDQRLAAEQKIISYWDSQIPAVYKLWTRAQRDIFKEVRAVVPANAFSQAASSAVAIPRAQVPHPYFNQVTAVTKKAEAFIDQLSFPYAKKRFLFTKGIAHKIEYPSEDFPAKVFLPAFLDSIFETAKSSGDLKDTKIVFLEAGAGPLYTAAQIMAKAKGDFPQEQLKAVWATMGNDRAVQADKKQGVLFIKYLVDQGVIKNNAKNNLVVVDTDAGFDNLGTASIFARTVLNNDVLRQANERFGLNIQPFNEAGGGNSIQFMYLHSEYERPDGAAIYKYHVAKEEFAPDAGSKIRISGFNGNKSVFNSYEISKLWRPIDLFGKTYAIEEKFAMDANDQVSVVRKPAYGQFMEGQKITDQKTLELARGIEDFGLSIGILEVLAARGYDVSTQARKMFADFQSLVGRAGAASSSLISDTLREEIAVRDQMVKAMINRLGLDLDRYTGGAQGLYQFSKILAHRMDIPEDGLGDQVFLPRFIDDVFARAKEIGGATTAKIVFLEAGAKPLYDAANLMARVSNAYPADSLKDVWATMGNYKEMQADPEQAVLFIKYLVDQGVISGQSGQPQKLLFVDTDTGFSDLGTALIFTKTLLDPAVIKKANEKFGLNIQPFNESPDGNTLEIMYMFSDYNVSPQKWALHIGKDNIPPAVEQKLRIKGYNSKDGSPIKNYIAWTWNHLDLFVKTTSIFDRFYLNSKTGRVSIKRKEPYGQAYLDIDKLKVARALQDTGLLMGVLDVMQSRGYDVTAEANKLISDLQTAYVKSGFFQPPASASSALGFNRENVAARLDRLKNLFKTYDRGILDYIKGGVAQISFLSRKVVHRMDDPIGLNDQVFLPKFIDAIFDKAGKLGKPEETKIVFLEAGAKPLYDAARLTNQFTQQYPADQLKSVWATMGNYEAMQDDPEQGVLFIKYLVDQGVLTPETKNLLIVDTDIGGDNLGTALVFTKSLLDPETLRKANERFGLNIAPFNEGGNNLEFLYMYSDYVSNPKKWDTHIKQDGISPAMEQKLRVASYNVSIQATLTNYIADWWSTIDSFVKTGSIARRFSIDPGTGKAVVTEQEPYEQDSEDIRVLKLARAVEDTTLALSMLDVLEARGYDVKAKEDELLKGLENAYVNSGLMDAAASSPVMASLPAQPDVKKVQARHARVQSVIQKYDHGILDHIDTIAGFYARGASVVHSVDDPVPLFDDQVFLPKFLDAAFDKAKSLGDKTATKMVFLDAGARPLYDAARLMAQAAGDFPVENLTSIWATMGNYLAIRSDREQAILFIKFLVDQGVLTPETKHLLIVDTDTGQMSSNPRLQDSPIGTALIFAKTLLVDDVVAEANQRYGLNIKPFNVGEGGNTLDILYMYSDYNATATEQMKQQRWDDHVRVSQISPEIAARLHVEGFNKGVEEGITNYIGDLWFPVDNFTKTENIADRFSVNAATGKVEVVPAALYDQASDDVRELKLARAIEDTGLRIAMLDVLEARGYDVAAQEKAVLNDLESAYKNSGLLDEPADAAASSTLTPGGIDLKADKLKLDIRGDQSPIQFNFDTEQLQNLQFDGLVPVIINMTPVVNLPMFLSANALPGDKNS